MSTVDASSDAVAAERPALLGLAYRLLGSFAEAEDAVQSGYERWLRLPEVERAEIRSPGAWLTRVVGRICLDELGSARARREAYVGEWLPEPLPDAPGVFGGRFAAAPPADPAEHAELAEGVSTAMLVVLETLTPAERVAFVLHEAFGLPFAEIAEVVGRSPGACRQLASSARARVRAGRAGAASAEQHAAVVHAFLAAAATGRIEALVELLDPDARLVSDGGGIVSAARRPVLGAEHVARYVLGIIAKRGEGLSISLRDAASGYVAVFAQDGVVDTVVSVEVREGRLSELWLVRNPEKLARWQGLSA
ncbi:RNA polymerase sigma factor SigJ [Agromyces mediolanus]|uniref:RNA polymerase sigma factor n=1 Tax=Agromyces mediolanus TaxID=41986 RepID=A0A918CLI8_AGRME|nr:RNA polymerase sigma factor SigJ [Agromyces mediolanus]GGR31333.1 RNA polymerase sigma factor [Agromyces mediolanus]GLJ72493.1 RNA polymerase sigma factor [Agromyces mediolanus]